MVNRKETQFTVYLTFLLGLEKLRSKIRKAIVGSGQSGTGIVAEEVMSVQRLIDSLCGRPWESGLPLWLEAF
jgi:hypothetical protein